MKTIILTLSLTLIALLSMPLSAAPYQQSEKQYDRKIDRQTDRRIDNQSSRRFDDSDRKRITRQQAADIAQREHPGRVLGVKQKSKTYRVRTLNRRGELRETRINARDGKVLRRRK